MKNFEYIVIVPVMIAIGLAVNADQFIPDFDKMQMIRCDYEETLYNDDGSEVSTSSKHILFRIDDQYQRVYIHREPIDHLLNLDSGRIEYNLQTMSDDYIAMEHAVVDRTAGTYTAAARITYDNEIYGIRTSKSSGTCKVLQ